MRIPISEGGRTGRAAVGAALLLIQILAVGGVAHASLVRYLVATVQQVIDGDSLVAVSITGARLKLRLLEIKAPEIPRGRKRGESYGKEARDFLARLLEGKTLRVWIYGEGRTKEFLAVLWAETINVNLEMVRQGLAEVRRDDHCRRDCPELEGLEEAQMQAQRARRGMWAREAGR
jgi:micrococcal nuclease